MGRQAQYDARTLRRLIRDAEACLRALDLVRPEYLARPENAQRVAAERTELRDAIARRRAKLGHLTGRAER